MEERLMVVFRFVGLAALTLALGSLAAAQGRSGEPTLPDSQAASPAGSARAPSNLAYVLYSLEDLGADPDFGRWVSETIPEVIAPGTWKGPGVLRYYAPRNLLVVSHTPAVQAQVRGFLKDVKKSLARGDGGNPAGPTAPVRDRAVAPAEYRAPLLLRAADPVAEQPLAYPVPAPARPPKHLFHFIIRYEGQGIIDDNVLKAIKTQYGANTKEAGGKEAGTTPAATAASSVSSTAAPALIPPPPPNNIAKEAKKEDKKSDKKEDQGP
jgi:hypothetical protein